MMLRKFGLVGTFSDDCSKPVKEGGARAIYEVPATGGFPTFTAVNGYGTFRSQIERTDQFNADTLIMYVVHSDGAWDKIDIQKEGTGFRTIKMVVYKRNAWSPSVTAIDSSADGLVLAKCSD
jgi:hypothetical protein